jgi:ribonuclease HII
MSTGQIFCASFFSSFPPATADTNYYEQTLKGKGFPLIAGVDEAGRGPLAGPVVASSVILPPHCNYKCFKDSKKLSAKQRVELFEYLYSLENAHIGIGIVSAEKIEELNILQASLLAMKQAVYDMAVNHETKLPSFLLVDGKFEVPVCLPQKTLIKGESKSCSIAAASIVAKVTRDRLMEEYHLRFPVYNFIQNKGYPTKEHRLSIQQHGPSPIHRRTFKGVKEYCTKGITVFLHQKKLW